MAPARANPRGPVVQGTDEDGRKACRQAQTAKPAHTPRLRPPRAGTILKAGLRAREQGVSPSIRAPSHAWSTVA